MEAANATNELFLRYGAKPGPQPDLAALRRNMTEYEDQYAAAMNFLIRFQARQAVSTKMFMAGLAPEQRTPVARGVRGHPPHRRRDDPGRHQLGARRSKPANARLVAAAIRDTREVWASYFLPRDRARVIGCSPTLPSGCRMRRRGPISPPSRPHFAP